MVKLIAFLKRKPGISMEEFKRRWVVEHTKLSTQIPNVRGYRINIAIDQQPGGAQSPFDQKGELIYDGTAELWFDSVEAMEAAFATEIARIAGADADQFAEVRIHLYTEEHIILPGPAPDTRVEPR